jgi:F0F1-type ATP synthase membrane subunit b/b'
MSLLFKGINIAILLLILFWFLKKKMETYFQQQRDELDGHMRRAAAELEKIEQDYQQVSDKMAGLDAQLSEMQKQSEESIQKDVQRLKKDADALIQKMSMEAEQRMDNELGKAKAEFTNELIDAALAGARAELNSKMSKMDESWTVKMVSDGMSAEKGSRERANYAS